MIRAYNHTVFLLKWVDRAIFNQLVIDLRVQNHTGQIEFLIELLLPLLSKHSREEVNLTNVVLNREMADERLEKLGIKKRA